MEKLICTNTDIFDDPMFTKGKRYCLYNKNWVDDDKGRPRFILTNKEQIRFLSYNKKDVACYAYFKKVEFDLTIKKDLCCMITNEKFGASQ